MDMSAKVDGVDDLLRTFQAAFPDNPKKWQQITHSAMGGAARKSMLPIAKQLAKRGDSSGALSESINVRVQPKRMRSGKFGGMYIAPIRYDKKAIAKYIQYYYTSKGKTPTAGNIDGIRHGHLVEFGHDVVRGGKVVSHVSAMPYLWPGAKTGSPQYYAEFKKLIFKRIDAAVERERKKRQGK